MLEIILDRHVLFVLMGILTVLGIVSKCHFETSGARSREYEQKHPSAHAPGARQV